MMNEQRGDIYTLEIAYLPRLIWPILFSFLIFRGCFTCLMGSTSWQNIRASENVGHILP